MKRPLSLVQPLGLAWVIAGAVCFASTAHGQLTHYVPFDTGYTAGTDLNGSGGSDLGFGANTWFDGAPAGTGTTVIASNLNGPGGLPVAGNHASTAPLDFNLAFYTFDQDNDAANGEPEDALATGEHWISFIARSETAADFGGVSLVKFFGPEVLYIGKVGGNGGTEWGLDPQNGTGQFAAPGSDATVDTFLVAKLTLGAGANDDTIDLFVNPALGVTPTTPDVSVAFNEDPANNRAIDELRIGGQNGAFLVDEVRIGATFADVTPGGAVIDGDADCDGDVDLDDFNILAANFGQGANTGKTVGDFDGDGDTDLDDFNILAANFGTGTGPESPGALPEPGTLSLLALGGAVLMRRNSLTER